MVLLTPLKENRFYSPFSNCNHPCDRLMSSSGIAWKIMQFLMKCSLQILLSWLNLLEYFEQLFLHRYEIMLYANQQRNKPPKKNQPKKPTTKIQPNKTSVRFLDTKNFIKKIHLHWMPVDAQQIIIRRLVITVINTAKKLMLYCL